MRDRESQRKLIIVLQLLPIFPSEDHAQSEKIIFLGSAKSSNFKKKHSCFPHRYTVFLNETRGENPTINNQSKICEITRYTRLGFRGETGENRGFFSSMEGGGGGGVGGGGGGGAEAAAEKGKGKDGGHLLFQNALPSLPYSLPPPTNLSLSVEVLKRSPPPPLPSKPTVLLKYSTLDG